VGQAAPAPAEGLIALECQAQIATRAVSCRAPASAGAGAGAQDIIVGGQNVYVKLTSSNVQLVAPDTFAFDVSVQNLLSQAMAVDSLTGAFDPSGVRVFFASGPTVTATTGGPGTISVANADGTGTFLAPNQRYFQYSGAAALGADQVLSTSETSGNKTWKLQYSPNVSTFSFLLYVNAPVQFPNGWVDVYPPLHSPSPTFVGTHTLAATQTLQLTDSVRNAVGKVAGPQTVTWTTTGHGAATVNSSGLVTAVADGVDSIIATGTAGRTGRVEIVVSTASPATTTIDLSPVSIVSGDSSTVTVQVKNGAGANITTGGATITLGTNGGTLTSPVDNNNGTYTARYTHTVAGSYKVFGTLNGNAITDTADVTVTAGTASGMAANSATSPTATVDSNVGAPPSVLVTDGASNPVAGVVVTFTVTAGGGQVSNGVDPAGASATVTTNASGIATLTSWKVGTAAGSSNNTVQATATALTPVNFASSATAGAAANMVKSAGDGQNAVVNTNVATAPAVTVTDAFSNPVAGVSVTFTPASGGGSVTSSPATTNASGVATVGSWKVGTTVGANTLNASATGPATVTFNATATPDVPAAITKTTTDPQSGTVGAAVGTPPGVHVADQFGNAVPGVTVNFAVTGGGGSTTGAAPTTNASGNAAVGSWTLGGSSLNTLSATASGGSNPSTSFTAYVPPVANTDSSQAMGNSALPSAVTPNVLTNDQSPNGGTNVVTTTGALTTVRNGTVTLAANGVFSYAPPAGNVLRDSVLYSINDGFASASSYIKIRFVGKVWYVDNTNGGSADGRDVSPFTSIATAEAVAGANDSILVRTGSGTTAGGTLKAGQLVYAQGASAAFTTSLNGNSVTLLSAGSAPSIGALTLGSGNTLRGFTDVGGITGTSFGTLTVSETGINNPSGLALSLTTGTLAGGFTSLISGGGTNNVLLSGVSTSGTSTLGTSGNALSGATGDGVVVSGGAGSFTFPCTVTNATSFAVNVNGKTGGTVTFSGNINPGGANRGISVASNSSGANTIVFSGGTKAISSSTAPGVTLTNNTGATIQFTGGGLAIATTTGTPFTATGGGTVEVSGSGNTISATGAAANAVNLSGITLAAGGMAFASIGSSGTTTSSAFTATSVGNTSGSTFTAGSLTVAGTTGGSSRGLSLTTNSAPFTFTTVSINGTGAEGIGLNGNTGAVAVNGGTVGNTSNTTGDALFVSGGNAAITIVPTLTKSSAGRIANIGSHTAGAVTVSGNLSCTSSCTGINVASNSGGTIDFTAGAKTVNTGASQAVTLSSNSGATVNFTGGGLAITTTSAGGFSATGGGTITVQGSNNTISGPVSLGNGNTALNVNNTTIGGSGLNFLSITAANGSNGINLTSTGASGGLTVSGSGTNGSGGSITNMSGSDAAVAGNGIYLNAAQKINLSWMAFSGSQNNGIYGTGVRGGLTLDHVRFTGLANGAGASAANNESDVQMVNIGGPIKFTNSRFDGAGYNAIRIENITGTAPVIDSLVFAFDSVNTMQGSTSDVRGSAMLVSLQDGSGDVRIRNNNITTWWGNAIHVLINNSATGTARITNNFADNTNGALAGAGGIWVAGSNMGFNISNNTVRHTNGTAISVDRDKDGGGTFQGTIDANTIGVSGDANSGSFTGTGIHVGHTGPATSTIKVSNNVLRQINGSANGAIWSESGDALTGGGSGTINVTMTGNNIQESGTTVNAAQEGILITHGEQSGPPNDTDVGCYDINSNTIANFNTASVANRWNLIRVNQRFGTTSRWPGYTGAATGVTSQTDIGTYLLGRNTASNTINANTSTGGFLNTSPAGSACPQPSM